MACPDVLAEVYRRRIIPPTGWVSNPIPKNTEPSSTEDDPKRKGEIRDTGNGKDYHMAETADHRQVDSVVNELEAEQRSRKAAET